MINSVNQQKPSLSSEHNTNKAKASARADMSPNVDSAAKASVKSASQLKQILKPVLPAAAFPSDKLSASIVSFARFFSLPLKPQLLADIRRRALLAASHNADSSKTAETAKQMTALSLAAAAAESKGAELSSDSQLNLKALESYAAAVDPDSRRRQNDEERRQKRDNNENEKERIKPEVITADSLKNLFMEYSLENPVIDIMNRLPGKNGQRWIVFPLDFSDGNNNYYVTMRALIDDNKLMNSGSISMNPVMFALDVVINSGQDEDRIKRRLFIFEFADEKPARLSVILHPEPQKKEQARFIKDLSNIFDIPLERVFLKTVESDSFPFEAELREKIQSVDKAV